MTANPIGAWVAQQARNLMLTHEGQSPRFLIRDRDAKFGAPFDAAFASEGVEIIRTPIRTPRANAYAERWVRTVRAECLDSLLIANRRHLERVVYIYVEHNRRRPHRGLQLCPPVGSGHTDHAGSVTGVRRRDVLGGLIHEYEQAA